MDPDTLEPIVEAVLDGHPAGLDEQGFLQRLRAHPDSGLGRGRAVTGLDLFRQHFLLHHVLYRLRDRLRATGTGDVDIDPLCIRRRPYRADRPGVGPHDHLRSYYLDIGHLERTDAADVAAMLSGFAEDLRRRERRAEAMVELELSEPFDEADVRRQYRRLAMRHHPDRGGDAQRLQAIHRALGTLLPRARRDA